RTSAEVLLAAEAGDAPGVLAAYARLEKQSVAIDRLYFVGDALEKTGRPDEAAAVFERLAKHPLAWGEPITSTRAWYRLALLRDKAGDAEGVRAAFLEVVLRWGGAPTDTPEV